MLQWCYRSSNGPFLRQAFNFELTELRISFTIINTFSYKLNTKQIILPWYLGFPSVLIWQITCLSQYHQSSFLWPEQTPPQPPVKRERHISKQLWNTTKFCCTKFARVHSTYPEISNFFLLLQDLKEWGEVVRTVYVSWSHTQSINISSFVVNTQAVWAKRVYLPTNLICDIGWHVTFDWGFTDPLFDQRV